MTARTSSRPEADDRSAPSKLHVTRQRDGTIAVSGDIDAASAAELDRALVWHERTPQGGRSDVPLVIDMRDVGFVDSSGLRTLVAASLRAGNRGTRVVLRNAASDLIRLLEITGLTQQLGVRRSEPGPHPSQDEQPVNEAERRYGADESPS